MKKGLPNILPLPNSRQKPWQYFFWQCSCFFALFFGKHMQVAYTWTGLSLHGSLTQDDTRGLEFAGNAFQVKDKDSGTANGFHVCLASGMRSVGHFPEKSGAAKH